MTVRSFARQSPRLAITAASAIGFAAALVMSATAQGANWMTPFSEENGGKSVVCASGIDGVRCTNDCDDITFSCARREAITTPSEQYATHWFSDKYREPILKTIVNDTDSAICSVGQIVTNADCRGGWCDDMRLYCAPSQYTVAGGQDYGIWFTQAKGRSPCFMTSISGNEETVHPDHVLVGMACSGAYCSRLSLTFCPVAAPAQDFAKPQGKWVQVCQGGNDCSTSVQSGVTVGKSLAESWSSSTENSLELAITAGVEFDLGAGETTLTAATSSTIETAREIVNSSEINRGDSCETSVDMSHESIWRVWQWAVTTQMRGETVTVKTCILTCTGRDNTGLPPYGPDDPRNDTCTPDDKWRVGVSGQNITGAILQPVGGQGRPLTLDRDHTGHWTIVQTVSNEKFYDLREGERTDTHVDLGADSVHFQFRLDLARMQLVGRYMDSSPNYRPGVAFQPVYDVVDTWRDKPND